MTEPEATRSMILSFRLLELQSLLVFAGKSKLGKKTELQVSRYTVVNTLKAGLRYRGGGNLHIGPQVVFWFPNWVF